MQGKWTISDTEEVFREDEIFDSKEEAIKGGRSYYEDDENIGGFYIGQINMFDLQKYKKQLLTMIAEFLNDVAIQEAGEFAEYYPDIANGDSADKAFEQFLESIPKPKFYSVYKTEFINLGL